MIKSSPFGSRGVGRGGPAPLGSSGFEGAGGGGGGGGEGSMSHVRIKRINSNVACH